MYTKINCPRNWLAAARNSFISAGSPASCTQAFKLRTQLPATNRAGEEQHLLLDLVVVHLACVSAKSQRGAATLVGASP